MPSWLIVALVLLPTSLHAQGLTPESLQGVVINATVNYRGTFSTTTGSGPGRITTTARISIGPGGTVQSVHRRDVIAEARKGEKSGSLSRNFSGRIGTPGNYSGGNFVWLLQGNQLVLLRTIEVGGFKMIITLSGNGNAMGCTVSAPYMREQGAGSGRDDSVFGGKATISDMNQTSSQCSVSRG